MGAEGFFHANFTGTLRHGDKHDVHQSHPADAEREQTDEAEQNLDSGRDDLQVEQIGEYVEHKDGAVIFGIKAMVKRHGLTNRLHDLGVVTLVFHHHGSDVV